MKRMDNLGIIDTIKGWLTCRRGDNITRCREKALTEEDLAQAEWKGYWRGVFSECNRILVFDTETTGLDQEANDMLSLPYQLIEIDADEHGYETTVIEQADYFFDWPEDETRVTPKAIAVNGLTKERLAELGTTDKKIALESFANALERTWIAIAHNSSFDVGFVDAAAQEEGLQMKWKRVYDTMTNMTEYCALPWYDGAGRHKWPRLGELADCLGVDTSGINYHQSSADVEVTKQCFLKIVEEGLDYRQI